MESKSQTLKEKRQELIKIKEELRQAREKTTQSWLNSRPLIDELERLKSRLEIPLAKNSESQTLVFELESELNAIESSIKSKKEGEIKATNTSEELTLTLEQLRQETETLKRHSAEFRQKRPRLKQGLRVKRQKLRASQLMLEAAKKEIEAYSEVANEAIKNSSLESEAESVKMSHEEYEALTKRGDEERDHADWLIAVATEEKAEAMKSRDLALAKWNEMKNRRVIRMKRRIVREENIEKGEELGQENQLGLVEIVDEIDNNKVTIQNKEIKPSDNKENYRYYQREGKVRRTIVKPKRKNHNHNHKNIIKNNKKKRSFLMKIRQCFMINIIKRLFG